MDGFSPRRERVVARIVRTVLPAHPRLALDARAHVERDVTSYVSSQIESMPSHLRIPYQLVLMVFDLLPLFRRGRRFVELGPSSQATYLNQWSNAPIAVMCDFVKLARSCALFAYFDHALVRRRLRIDQPESEMRAGRWAGDAPG